MEFNEAIEHVLAKEGGFQDDPDDNGNWTGGRKGKGLLKGTNWGISAAAYPKLDIYNLTREKAIEIYRKDYWAAAYCDLLPAKIRLSVFDTAVNSGSYTAIRLLQKAINRKEVKVDGIFGEITKRNLIYVTLAKFTDTRIDFYFDQNNTKFLKGWIKRAGYIASVS